MNYFSHPQVYIYIRKHTRSEVNCKLKHLPRARFSAQNCCWLRVVCVWIIQQRLVRLLVNNESSQKGNFVYYFASDGRVQVSVCRAEFIDTRSCWTNANAPHLPDFNCWYPQQQYWDRRSDVRTFRQTNETCLSESLTYRTTDKIIVYYRGDFSRRVTGILFADCEQVENENPRANLKRVFFAFSQTDYKRSKYFLVENPARNRPWGGIKIAISGAWKLP